MGGKKSLAVCSDWDGWEEVLLCIVIGMGGKKSLAVCSDWDGWEEVSCCA